MRLSLIIFLAIAIRGQSDVPMFVDLWAEWQPRPDNEKIETYWIFQRIGISPIRTVALVTTNRSSAVIQNVNTLLSYEWTIAASNSLGIGVASDLQMTPINPGVVTGAKIVSLQTKITPPCVIEEGTSLKEWKKRMVIIGSGTNWSFTYTLAPDDSYKFWRFRNVIDASEFVPRHQ